MAVDLFPSPGLLVDRRTILTLKIDAVGSTGHSVDALLEERDEVGQKLNGVMEAKGHVSSGITAEPNRSRTVKEVQENLSMVNRRLWRAEDEVRSLSDKDIRRLAELAKLIATLNDYRADQIAKVNIVFGHTIDPKVYR